MLLLTSLLWLCIGLYISAPILGCIYNYRYYIFLLVIFDPYVVPSLPLVTVFILKPSLSDISIVFFWFPFALEYLFPLLTFQSVCVPELDSCLLKLFQSYSPAVVLIYISSALIFCSPVFIYSSRFLLSVFSLD